MSGKQIMTWNGDADAKLLVAILKVSEVKLDYEAIAKELKCTTRAVQERLKKLRKLAQTGAETSTAGKSSPKTPSKAPRQKPTPPTKSRKTPSKPSSGGKGKKAAKDKAIADDSDEDVAVKEEVDSDDEEYTPASKKRKRNQAFDASSDLGEESLDEEDEISD